MSFDLSDILFYWGNPPVPFTLRNACEGCFICGEIGSGKSTGSGVHAVMAYARAGYGGLALTVKEDETEKLLGYFRAAGRESDVIILRPDDGDKGHRFNFLDYEMTRPGRGSGITSNVVNTLTNAFSPGIGSRVGTQDPFWEKAVRKYLHCGVETVVLAGEALTLRLLSDVLLSAPHTEDEARSPAFLEHSICALLLRKASNRKDLPKPRRDDLTYTIAYWGVEFPRLADKTRSIIESSLSATVDGLLRSPLRELFCTDTTITPERSFEGAIIILDIPTVEFGDIGRDAQLLFKTSWMNAVARRAITESSRPVFLFQDEAQQFLTGLDRNFVAICRDRLAAVVSLTQNLSGFYSVMNGNDPRMATDSYVGSLVTKIFHANSDPATMEYVERLFGKVRRYRGGSSMSIEGRSPGQKSEGPAVRRNMDFSREERPLVPGSSLRSLRRGGEGNKWEVDAIIDHAGHLVRHVFVQEHLRG